MGPEAMPQEEAPPQEEGGGEITKLAQQVGDGLAKLSEVLNGSQAATDQDREKMAMVLNGFIELVESNLGAAGPGEDAPQAEPDVASNVPAMGGVSGVPMGPNSRN